jgi:serine/threonine protein kinase
VALEHVHSKGFIHRDIKPENIHLLDNGQIKLLDFGWSNVESKNKRQTYAGTLIYQPPEMLEGNRDHDSGMDVWCVGVLMYELLFGVDPFSPVEPAGSIDAQRATIKTNITKLKYKFPTTATDGLVKDLIRRILKPTATRYKLSDILGHAWILGHCPSPRDSSKAADGNPDAEKEFKQNYSKFLNDNKAELSTVLSTSESEGGYSMEEIGSLVSRDSCMNVGDSMLTINKVYQSPNMPDFDSNVTMKKHASPQPKEREAPGLATEKYTAGNIYGKHGKPSIAKGTTEELFGVVQDNKRLQGENL